MVGKLSRVSQIPASTRVAAKRKKEARKAEKQSDNSSSLTETILSKIDFGEVGSDSELRRKLIYETLTEAFGDEVVSSPKFKKLIDEIDAIFSRDQNLQAQLDSLKSEKKLEF